jgi:hypothetical protein
MPIRKNAPIVTDGFLPVVVSGDTLMHATVRMMPTLMWMLIWNDNSICYSQCTSSTGTLSSTKIKNNSATMMTWIEATDTTMKSFLTFPTLTTY